MILLSHFYNSTALMIPLFNYNIQEMLPFYTSFAIIIRIYYLQILRILFFLYEIKSLVICHIYPL